MSLARVFLATLPLALQTSEAWAPVANPTSTGPADFLNFGNILTATAQLDWTGPWFICLLAMFGNLPPDSVRYVLCTVEGGLHAVLRYMLAVLRDKLIEGLIIAFAMSAIHIAGHLLRAAG